MGSTYTRILTIIAVGLFVLLGGWAEYDAHAQDARTRKSTRVMERKGPASRVVKRLPAGKRVKILAREGQWVKIRVGGRTGWVKKSTLILPRKSSSKRRPRKSRFGRKGRSGTAPTNKVGADAVKGAEASKDTDKDTTKRSANDGDDDDDDADDDDDDDDTRAAVNDDAGNGDDGDDGGDGDGDGDDDDDDDDGEPRSSQVERTAARSALRRLEQNREDGDDDDDDGDGDDDDDEELNIVMVVKSDKVIMRRKPKRRATKLDTLYKGAQLTVLQRAPSGDWYFVENSNGEQGWIKTSAVRPPGGAGYPELMIRTSARAGYTLMSQRFLSDGGPNYELSQYTIASGAAAIDLGADVIYHVTPSIVVGGRISYMNQYATPGIHYEDANGNATDTGFMVHDVDVQALVGMDFRNPRGVLALAHLGYHYDLFSIANFDDPAVNLAQLPSENTTGLSVGVRLEVPRLTGNLGVRVGGDFLLPTATVTQTDGLMDGAFESLDSFGAGALFTYQMAAFQLEAGYRFAYAKTIWSGAAQRGTGAVQASFRKDSTHVLSVGVGKSF